IDKITILEIKAARIADAAKLANIRRELQALIAVRDAQGTAPAALVAELGQVNEQLWDIEDRIRECEQRGDFGAAFIELARSVYKTNDRRAALKRKINDAMESELVEEKSYRGS
ncbi:MAG: hypothetical protein JNM30_22010, partial [Rhodospirillales bacterium]|nr:hypothetical protein [Rhodospirillales bacterium]